MNKKNLIFEAKMAIFVVLAIFVVSSTGWAATFYVDATNGNDNNNGLSPSTPWQTIAKVNASSFNPGDNILFKRNETWRESHNRNRQLMVPSSGLNGNPIVFGAYGSGDKPIISGADVMSTWTEYSASIWQNTGTNTEPNQVVMDGVVLTKGSDRDSFNDHERYWAGNVLYVKDDTGDPDGSVTIEASQRAKGIFNTKSYITLDGLIMKYANSTGINVNQSLSNIIVDSVTCEYNYIWGLLVRGKLS